MHSDIIWRTPSRCQCQSKCNHCRWQKEERQLQLLQWSWTLGKGLLLRLHNTNSELRTPVLFLGWNSGPPPRLNPESPICATLHIIFPIFGSHPVILICLPICISFSSIAFTLPYLLFPAFPSVMSVPPILLISDIPGHTSDPPGLSLCVHNTFQTWKVLCSLSVQTSSYISSTTPVCFLSSNLDLSST